MNRFAVLLAVVFTVVALWCGGWFFGAWWIRDQIGRQAFGAPAIGCAELAIAGLPFRFDITCTGTRLGGGDVTMDIAELRASVLVYNPTFTEIFAKGPAVLSDAFSGASYRLDWESLKASVRLDWTALERASLVADGLVLSDSVLDVTEMARARHLELHALGAAGALGMDKRNLRVFARIENAELGLFDDPVEVKASALVNEWPADIRQWTGPGSLQAWAVDGGSLEIEEAALATGKLSAGLSGTLAPDGGGLVNGKLVLTSRGVGPLLRDFLAAPLAGALLGPEDETGTARQTLVFSHSVLRAGIVPLIELPPLF
ncbi:MAG: DUF2125 domain-containing protein [Alphaproteobacteria bacterium]|nr:DUF2125 domain-containing protein [Alphaproteobacteria bacterium]